MKVHQQIIKNEFEELDLQLDFKPSIFLLFVSPGFKNTEGFISKLKSKFPDTIITGCSTSGEIADVSVMDDSIVLNAILFEKTKLKVETFPIEHSSKSLEVGQFLYDSLYDRDLQHLLVLSDGLHVNGAELVKGLTLDHDTQISVTGGLAGDGTAFENTFIIHDDKILEKQIVGIGFYGNELKVGYSSKGGWDSFGIERTVTKSDENILYELDGEPALDLYKTFLGPQKAKELPGSGLLFPLSLREDESKKAVVRTILAVNEEDKSLTFAGSLPQGSNVRMMKANMDRLIDGAEKSALESNELNDQTQFALLISCVGRRLVLKQMVEEEVEVVREVLGSKAIISGFYSYGELAPFGKFEACRLHNQTMTITTFSE